MNTSHQYQLYGRPSFRPGKLYKQMVPTHPFYLFPACAEHRFFSRGSIFMHIRQITDPKERFCSGDIFLGPDGIQHISWPGSDVFVLEEKE